MHILIGLLGATIGIGISYYIHHQKKKKTKLVCPRESNCEQVVHSTYATTAGIDNTLLGLAYYTIVAILYAAVLVLPSLLTAPMLWVLTLMTCMGALFSIYLTALQAVVIRAWCMWCLGSTFATLLLVIALFGHNMYDLFALLYEQRIWWVIIHNIGFILGLGAATITDIFFLRFLRHGRISEQGKATMDTLSNIIWIGLMILIVSGLMLYLPEQMRLNNSPKFLLKVFAIGVLVINGIALNLFVGPRMRSFSLAQTRPAKHFRRLAFALGGISIASWYTAFLLGSLRQITLPLREGIATYVAMLMVVVIGSQIYERIITGPTTDVRPPGHTDANLI